MKKIFLPILIAALALGCSSDDGGSYSNSSNNSNDNQQSTSNSIVRISQVNALEDQVTLTNFGADAIDVGDFFLCLGPGTYAQVSGLTTVSTSLSENESVTLSYDVNPDADGLSVFRTNTFASSDPNVLLDYMQWGSGNQARVDQAVTAGRWDDAQNVVDGVSVYTFNGTPTQFGSSFWEGEQARGVVRILNVNTSQDQVTLTNLGNTAIDAGDFWLCLGPGTYARVGNLVSTSTLLDPNQELVLSYDVNPIADGLSVFSSNTFGSSDPNVLVDYVQWGEANQARVGQAVTAGRWNNAADFIPAETSYQFNGSADDFGRAFWQ